MDLKTFEFPDLNNDRAVRHAASELLEEAIERGFYNGNTEYNKLFSNLFFNGGKTKFKKNLDENFTSKAWTFCRAYMSSWEPKHEHKEAICAMLMSELLETK